MATVQFHLAEGRGPRDALAYEPLLRAVVKTVASVGLDAETIIALLAIDDPIVAEQIRTLAPETAVPDTRLALRTWAACHTFEAAHMSPSYAGPCGYDLAKFTQFGERHDGRPVSFRANREIRQALLAWLGIAEFVRVVEDWTGKLEWMLKPVGPAEGDHGLAWLLQLAFKDTLGLPGDRVPDLWREAVERVCTADGALPSRDRTDDTVNNRLMAAYFHIVRTDIRPFVAPIWPAGSGDRVRAALRRRTWEDPEAAEVEYLCDGDALHASAHRALKEYQAAKAASDPELSAFHERVTAAQAACHALHKRLYRDHDARRASWSLIASWLNENAPDLIDLVRPCGDPLHTRR